MTKNHILDSKIFQVFLFVLAIVSIFFFEEFVEYQNVRYINDALLPLLVIFMLTKGYKLNMTEKIYVYALCVGFFSHVLVDVINITEIGNNLFARISPVIVLAIAMQQKRKPKIFIMFFVLFYVLECGISVYEKISMTHFYEYKNIENFSATRSLMDDNMVFRSFSLMFHPLFNANTVSICLAFIFCSNQIRRIYKYALIVLGLLALWGFNSRGALMIWGILIFYRIALYKAKLSYTIIILCVSYFAIPPLLEWIMYSGVFGRLTEIDFSDSSTLTRFAAFDAFQSEDWSMENILIGGKTICYPGTQLILENGPLLDLGYWGIVIGLIKVVCEILITYKAIVKYTTKDKILILLAVWGVAFMNNNSFQTWLMPMFVMACVTFNEHMLYRETEIKNIKN